MANLCPLIFLESLYFALEETLYLWPDHPAKKTIDSVKKQQWVKGYTKQDKKKKNKYFL